MLSRGSWAAAARRSGLLRRHCLSPPLRPQQLGHHPQHLVSQQQQLAMTIQHSRFMSTAAASSNSNHGGSNKDNKDNNNDNRNSQQPHQAAAGQDSQPQPQQRRSQPQHQSQSQSQSQTHAQRQPQRSKHQQHNNHRQNQANRKPTPQRCPRSSSSSPQSSSSHRSSSSSPPPPTPPRQWPDPQSLSLPELLALWPELRQANELRLLPAVASRAMGRLEEISGLLAMAEARAAAVLAQAQAQAEEAALVEQARQEKRAAGSEGTDSEENSSSDEASEETVTGSVMGDSASQGVSSSSSSSLASSSVSPEIAQETARQPIESKKQRREKKEQERREKRERKEQERREKKAMKKLKKQGLQGQQGQVQEQDHIRDQDHDQDELMNSSRAHTMAHDKVQASVEAGNATADASGAQKPVDAKLAEDAVADNNNNAAESAVTGDGEGVKDAANAVHSEAGVDVDAQADESVSPSPVPASPSPEELSAEAVTILRALLDPPATAPWLAASVDAAITVVVHKLLLRHERLVRLLPDGLVLAHMQHCVTGRALVEDPLVADDVVPASRLQLLKGSLPALPATRRLVQLLLERHYDFPSLREAWLVAAFLHQHSPGYAGDRRVLADLVEVERAPRRFEFGGSNRLHEADSLAYPDGEPEEPDDSNSSTSSSSSMTSNSSMSDISANSSNNSHTNANHNTDSSSSSSSSRSTDKDNDSFSDNDIDNDSDSHNNTDTDTDDSSSSSSVSTSSEPAPDLWTRVFTAIASSQLSRLAELSQAASRRYFMLGRWHLQGVQAHHSSAAYGFAANAPHVADGDGDEMGDGSDHNHSHSHSRSGSGTNGSSSSGGDGGAALANATINRGAKSAFNDVDLGGADLVSPPAPVECPPGEAFYLLGLARLGISHRVHVRHPILSSALTDAAESVGLATLRRREQLIDGPARLVRARACGVELSKNHQNNRHTRNNPNSPNSNSSKNNPNLANNQNTQNQTQDNSADNPGGLPRFFHSGARIGDPQGCSVAFAGPFDAELALLTHFWDLQMHPALSRMPAYCHAFFDRATAGLELAMAQVVRKPVGRGPQALDPRVWAHLRFLQSYQYSPNCWQGWPERLVQAVRTGLTGPGMGNSHRRRELIGQLLQLFDRAGFAHPGFTRLATEEILREPGAWLGSRYLLRWMHQVTDSDQAQLVLDAMAKLPGASSTWALVEMMALHNLREPPGFDMDQAFAARPEFLQMVSVIRWVLAERRDLVRYLHEDQVRRVVKSDVTVTQFQRDGLSSLQSIPLPKALFRDYPQASPDTVQAVVEYVNELGMPMDLAWPEIKFAVEMDGPSHYLTNAETGERLPNLPTRFRNRVLTAIGWRLLPIGVDSVDLRLSQAERHASLLRKLDELASSLQ